MSAELFDRASLKTEETGANQHKITFSVSAERFREGVNEAYNRTKWRFDIPGFRSGKAPRKIIEINYGKDIFFPEAADIMMSEVYEDIIELSGLDTVGYPEGDIENVADDGSAVFAIEVTTRPKAEIGEHKGLTYTESETEATDGEIDARIEQAREKNSRLVSAERPAALGDVVTLDYEGSIDGVKFDGGSAENHELTLGSNAFIEGFENQLLGAEAGEEREVNLTFPEEYHAAELAGKPAVFKCSVKEIRVKELPELNDDFAQDVSEFDTFDEYRASVAGEIKKEKAEAADTDKENQLLKKLISGITADIPEVMIDLQMDQMFHDFKTRFESQGMPFSFYLQYTGQDEDDIIESMRENATERVKAQLALEAVAEKENLTVSDEELDAELERISKSLKMEKPKIKEALGRRELKSVLFDIRLKKAADFVTAAAVAVKAEA